MQEVLLARVWKLRYRRNCGNRGWCKPITKVWDRGSREESYCEAKIMGEEIVWIGKEWFSEA